MHKRKFFFIVFEGIEGSGKSYQSKKLFKNIKKKNYPVVLTREPGGTIGAERIRQVILKDYFHKNKSEKFHKYTDTLLYLAARNEHIQNKILKAEYAALDQKFNKINGKGEIRDMGKLATEKAKLIEKIINKGSANAKRCVEIASGSPLTEEELNGTPNRECPSFLACSLTGVPD